MENLRSTVEDRHYTWDIEVIPNVQVIDLCRTYKTEYDLHGGDPITQNTSNQVSFNYSDVQLNAYFKSSTDLANIISALLECQSKYFNDFENDADFEIEESVPAMKKDKDNVEEDYLDFAEV